MTTSETLFDKKCQIRWQIQENQSLHSSLPEKTPDRIISVRMVVKLNTISSPVHKRDLMIRLTDDSNCFFLYTAVIGEEDFSILKSQQCLNVDFNQFPESFISLISACEQPTNHHLSSSNYLLTLGSGSGSCGQADLNIIETSTFRQTVHLSLKFIQGDDSDVKDYLAECLGIYRERYDSTKTELANTRASFSNKLESAETEVERLETQKAELQRELLTQADQITAKFNTEMSALRDEKSREYDQKRRERDDFEQKTRMSQSAIETKLIQTETVNKELTERKFRAESQIREHRLKISGYEEEIDVIKIDLKKFRVLNKDLGSENHELEKKCSTLERDVALLQQEVDNKLDRINMIEQQKNSVEESKRDHEERVEDLRLDNKKLKDSKQSLADELCKANEIIKKLHTSNKELKYKNDMKNMVSIQQEEVVKQKSVENEDLKREFERMTIDNKSMEEVIGKNKVDMVEMGLKLKNNENCIQWLNKQLNEKQMQGQQVGGGSQFSGYSRNVTTASNFPLPQSHNSSGLPPKHMSTPLVRPVSRGSAAAAAMGLHGNDFLGTPISEGKHNQDLHHKENLSPRSDHNKNNEKDSFGLDPKYFAATPVPAPKHEKPTGNSNLVNNYMGGFAQRKLNSNM